MNRRLHLLLLAVFLPASLFAQDIPGRRTPSVTMAPAPLVTVTRGRSNVVPLSFTVAGGFHINSHKPHSEFLIPTVLKIDVPTDIAIERTTYPDGKDMSFAFEPNEKVSVYSGEFSLSVRVRPLSSVVPGKYKLHGALKYQACDNAACYPPKQLPVEFEVKVVKGPPLAHKNPAQSPHIHN